MPIFGQVWLWSSLAFLLGALLCWGLVALPARRRVGELEAELATRRRPTHPERPEPRHPAEERQEEYDPRRLLTGAPPEDDAQNEQLTRAYALSGTRGEAPPSRGARGLQAPPETDTELSDGPRASATQYLNVTGSGSLQAPPEVPPQPGDRGWFDDDDKKEQEDLPAVTTVMPAVPAEPVDVRLVDDGADEPDDGGTVFTQRTHPIPGELIRQLDESAPETPPTPPAPEPEPADSLVDDLADEDESPAEQTILTEPVASGESKHQLKEGSEVTSTLSPAGEPARGAHELTDAVPAPAVEEQTSVVSRSEQQTRGTEDKIMPGVTVQAEPSKNTLPKRVPSKPPRRTPFGVQTTSPATPPPPSESATPAGNANDAPRSLFEPIVPAGDGPPVPPPPHRMAQGNGRGPFGPGSAMPLPSGESPSPEFTIKASASARRYCTPDSDKFERTVAEVWFRSAADAERVGFRPLA